ncbi:MAG: DUF3857 domain-containing protein [Bacteroidales bacterium]|nr:DUF3857 domain-containing protein [Bacteroidales bacterium]
MKFSELIIFLIFPVLLFSQPKPPVKWKDISIEEMKMSEYDNDPNAPAVVLYDYGIRYFDINSGGRYLFLMKERIVRIKILAEEGLKYAQIKIPFHDLHCEKFYKENNISISARTYNLDESGKIITSKLKFKNIKFKDSTNCMRIASFTFPDVKPGAVIEYKYKVPTLDMIYPETWYFQSSIPVKHSELRFFVPNDFQYNFFTQNIDELDILNTQYYSKVLLARGQYSSQKENVDLSGKMYQFVLKNIPAFECREFIHSPKDFMPKINIHLERIQQRNQTEVWKYITYPIMITTNDFYYTKTPEQRRMIPYPAGYIHQTANWEELNNKMLKHHRFGMPLKLPWRDKGALDSVTNRKKTDLEKMQDIYNYVRNEIKWDSTYLIYADRVFDPFLGKLYLKVTNKFINEKSLRKSFEAKEGSNVEINFLLISFLKRMGLEADPVMLSTRDHGMIDTNIHDVSQFNHVIVRTKVDDEYIFLDAGDTLRPYNFVRKNSIGITGFLISENGYEWVKIHNKDITRSIISTDITIKENNTITGSVKNELSGYDALAIRHELLRDKKKSDVNNKIQTGLENATTFNPKIENLNNIDFPLIIKSGFKLAAGQSGKFIFKPKIDIKFTDDNFMENFRTCPVEFDYPFVYQYNIHISIPDNYTIEYPHDLSLQMFGNNVQFIYTIERKENELTLNIRYAIKQISFPANAYNAFSSFVYKIENKLNEEIIIQKN